MNLLKAASTVSLLTLASRITGLLREWVVAAQFGASAWTDAFNVAFRIPNLLRRLFAEGAFSQAFVPLLSTARAAGTGEGARSLIDSVATVMAWVLLAVSVIGVAVAPVLVWLMASGLERLDEAVLMTRLMFPYILFMSLAALCAGVLNTWRRFAVPAATPVLLNLCVVGAAWGLSGPLAARGLPAVYSLSAGVMLGGVLQLGVQLVALRRLGLLPRLGWTVPALRSAWRHDGVRRVLGQMGPAVLGVSVAQLSLVINTLIASYQPAGAVSWLSYADRLMELPTALLGVAFGVVLLPSLSAAQARGETRRYGALLDWGLRWVLLLGAPCGVALVLFAEPLVAVLYHYGAFRAVDVHQTALALRGYGVGLLGLLAVKILAPGYYAQQDVRTPVRIAVAVLVLTQCLNVVLVPWLGHAGLSLSIGLAAIVNAAVLYLGLRRRGTLPPETGWLSFLVRLGVATLALAAWLLWCSTQLDWIGLREAPWQRIGWLAGALAVAGGGYLLVLTVLGLKWREFARPAVAEESAPDPAP
jgi:putative peptidoglycan lipid II flippase